MSDPMTGYPSIPPPPPAAPPVEPEAPRHRAGMIAGAVVVSLALVAGASFVLLRDGSSAQARPLALRFTEGQSETYAIQQTMDGQISSDLEGSDLFGDMPLAMDMTQVMTWEVLSVDDDGLATIEVSVSEMSGSVNGIDVPDTTTAVPPMEIVIAPDGRIVSAGGLALGGAGQTQGFGFPGMGQLTPILPDDGDAVAPGDSWDKEFSQDFPFGEGTIAYTASSTYDRDESVDGREAAVIVTQMNVPMDLTMDLGALMDSFGGELGASGPTGLGDLANASIATSGSGSITQTSFVDLEAEELLRSESSGTFDLTMEYRGIPGLEGAITFAGTFTQDMERR
ncbi:MAG: hypothetical protein ACXWYN_05170 [Actinomycetota bacterium]